MNLIKMTRMGMILLILCLGLLGCSGKSNSDNPGEKGAGKPPVAVEVTQVATADFTEGVEVIGSLSPKFSADVKSEYAGVVTEVYVTEWVRIKKGAPLARIDTREMEILLQKARAAVEMAKANLLQTEVVRNRAHREYERLLKLKENGLVTQQSLDEGLTEKEAAIARMAAAVAQLKVAEEDFQHTQTRLSKTTIRSPIDGIVSFRGVNVGDLVGEMGSPKMMFKIIDTRMLDLTVMVPSGEMGRVSTGQPLVFSSDAIPGSTFTGKVMFINPVVNETDRSMRVVAEVENLSEQLKGGLFIKGRIITGKRSNVLRIPRTALLLWDVTGKKGDLFVIEGERAKRRTVQTGAIMGDFVEITTGLSPSERVVTRGGFNLKDGDRVQVNPIAED